MAPYKVIRCNPSLQKPSASITQKVSLHVSVVDVSYSCTHCCVSCHGIMLICVGPVWFVNYLQESSGAAQAAGLFHICIL